ncbi:caspase family protein [Streptomyces sp. NPDC053431]|uniref:HD domain-containing protein n=1 Tax=Streptomyces sp. NPDC053431 TaxID=3365703 RepID=UPI0037D6FE1E
MGALRALLIAVPGDDLGFAVDDVARIRRALVDSGYAESDVRVLDSADTTTRNDIYAALDTLLGTCEDDDFALVYFSGHGVRIGEVDHLVPAGADPRAHRRGLVPVAPDDLLERLTSQATVMVCLDACRDDAHDEFQPPQGLPTYLRMRENVVFAYATAAGLPAMATAEGSFMGRALAEALSTDYPPRTVGEVLAHVRKRTTELAEDLGVDHEPEIRWLDGSTGGAHAKRVICGSEPGADGWKRAVRTSALWQRVTTGCDNPGELKRRLDLLVDKVLAIRGDAGRKDKAGPDPWEDPAFPERVLVQLDRLVPAAPEGKLGPLEAVALLAAPFVREAAVACGRRTLAELYDPYGEEITESAPGTFRGDLAADMADVRKAYRQIDDKRRRLRARAVGADASEATEQWLRHQLLADWDQLWAASTGSEETVGALESLSRVMDLLTEAAVAAVHQGGRKPSEQATRRLRLALQQVVMQMRTRPGLRAPDGEGWDDSLSLRIGPDVGKWRPQSLAGLLHVAELLAIDPRLLDGIVVDHLGVTHLRVEPSDVVRQVADSEFDRVEGPGWALDSGCENAALHVALERQAESVTAAVRILLKTFPNQDLFAALPRHVNTDALEPAHGGAYDAPPPRFQLSEDGIKPLIMGTQLYGDHTLAVRELYQNALDACRRREARQRYAAAARGSDASRVKPLANYTITFTLGRDDADGRIYIECHDPGIGMTAEELRDLFARAGRRYEQSPARVREMRRWRRKGIVPEQNSRFGIGVFSYFMLAESIRVTTRPASDDGHAAGESGHRVDVVADSGLMHITKAEGADAGTRVRLYLRPEYGKEPPSLVKVLREQVWYSDVAVKVVDELDGAGEPVHWRAGELRMPDAVPWPRRNDSRDDNVWWVPGLGARLVDGIFVRHDERPFGYVVNLRHQHAPVLSADRNRLQGFRAEAVHEDLRAAVDELLHWEFLQLDWLWDLTGSDTRAAGIVLERLLQAGVPVDVQQWFDKAVASAQRIQPLARLGCLPMDADTYVTSSVFEAGSLRTGSQLFLHWRHGLVETEDMYGKELAPDIGRPKGFPEPLPVDALLFRHKDKQISWCPGEAALRASRESGLGLRKAVRVLRRYAVAGVHVPETPDIRALDTIGSDPLSDELYTQYVIDGALARRATGGPDAAPLHAPLAHVAITTGRTIGQVAELLGRLRSYDVLVPEVPRLGDLHHHFPDAREQKLLTGKSVPGLAELPRVVTPVVAAYTAKRTRTEPAEVAAVARKYAPLGYQVTGNAEEAALSDDDMRTLGLTSDSLDTNIGLLNLVRLSAEREDPDVATTATAMSAALRRLGLGGLSPGSLGSVKAPSWWQFLGADSEGPAGPLGVWTVLRALEHRTHADSPESDLRAVTALAEEGVVHPNAVEAVRRRLDGTAPPRLQLLLADDRRIVGRAGSSRFPVSFSEPSDRVDAAFLVLLAADRRIPLGKLADMVRAEAEPFGIAVDDIPDEAHDLLPDFAEYLALFTRSRTWRTEITHREIVQYAANHGCSLDDAVARLRAYECLGGPRVVPRAGPVTVPAPEERDATLERLLFYAPLADGTVTPLALVTTAVRLERGLRSMHRALAPYARYGLALACPEPEDDTYEPDWRDVIILSRHLTGREPALGGDVSEDHIRLCAEETELTVPQVRERLRYYAPLFRLNVPPPPTDQEEPV